jgi:hypothetical protein
VVKLVFTGKATLPKKWRREGKGRGRSQRDRLYRKSHLTLGQGRAERAVTGAPLQHRARAALPGVAAGFVIRQ